MNKYNPSPIDTSKIILPIELEVLMEEIAKNVHEVWAAGRVSEGWVFGEERNTELKTTPCLVPYEQLPENEKDYDRNTALETLKVIYKLGYKICKNKVGE